jgi:hypothetical protein
MRADKNSLPGSLYQINFAGLSEFFAPRINADFADLTDCLFKILQLYAFAREMFPANAQSCIGFTGVMRA